MTALRLLGWLAAFVVAALFLLGCLWLPLLVGPAVIR